MGEWTAPHLLPEAGPRVEPDAHPQPAPRPVPGLARDVPHYGVLRVDDGDDDDEARSMLD